MDTEKLKDQHEADVDTLRDVYMTRAQREAYERLLAELEAAREIIEAQSSDVILAREIIEGPAMSADELLPLPEYLQQDLSHMSHEGMGEAIQAYARANVAHATAGLRAELERMTALRDGWGAAANEARAHADRYKAERDTARAELASAREAISKIKAAAELGLRHHQTGPGYTEEILRIADAAMQEQK